MELPNHPRLPAQLRHPSDDRKQGITMSKARIRIDPTHDGWPSHRMGGLVLLLIGAVLTDLITDRFSCGSDARLLMTKGLFTLLAIVGAFWIYLFLRSRSRVIRRLSTGLGQVQAEAERWRSESQTLASGLAVAIDEQFNRWELSSAEREVALLLIKGISTREVAELRQTKEPTVRQQAQSVYRKAALGGRADLAAFFLEDLLAPRESPRP